MLWFWSPLIFWGGGVIIHYLQSIALFNDWWQQDESITNERRYELELAPEDQKQPAE